MGADVSAALGLLLGLALAAGGGELFVRGTVGLAACARLPAGIIGATVGAFATSSPELAISVTAAGAGRPQIALGDALGSNVTNLGLILGVAALIAPLHPAGGTVRRDFSAALLAPVATVLLAIDGRMSRPDAAVLLAGFTVWLGVVVSHARAERSATEEVLAERGRWPALRAAVVGLVCLIAAGQFIVGAAKGIGAALGMDPYVVGATLVAIGSSTPELATTLLAQVRGHTEIGLGIVLGSNLFNGLFIVSIATLISPIVVPWRETRVTLLFGFLVVLSSRPGRSARLGRLRGFALLALYAVHTGLLVANPPTPG